MQKDFKIGMVLGLVVVMVAGVWLSTRPGVSPQVRLLRSDNAGFPSGDNSKLKIQDLPETIVHEQAKKIKTQRFHIVRKGQTLSEISYHYYGSVNQWQKIFDANRKVIKDANTLRPGIKLIIPD